jgi:hypothetical protein
MPFFLGVGFPSGTVVHILYILMHARVCVLVKYSDYVHKGLRTCQATDLYKVVWATWHSMFNLLPVVSGGSCSVLCFLSLCVRVWCSRLNFIKKWPIYTKSHMTVMLLGVVPTHFNSPQHGEQKDHHRRSAPVQQSQSESHHEQQSVSQAGSPSWCRAHLGAHDDAFRLSFQLLSESTIRCHTVDVLKIFIKTWLLGWRKRPLQNLCHHQKMGGGGGRWTTA